MNYEKNLFSKLSNAEMKMVNGGGIRLIHAELVKEAIVGSICEPLRPIYELSVVRPVKA